MGIVNLQAIISKVRRLTGSDTLQLPDSANPLNPNSVGIIDYINSFYAYDFPSEFRSLKLKDKYTFNTIQGIDTYSFNSEQYTTVEMPCYCAKREIKLFNDPWSFYGVNFNWQFQENFTSGNGTNGVYSGFTQATPIIRSINNDPATAGSPNVTPNTPPASGQPQPYPSQSYSGFPAARVQNILITANTASSTVNVTDDGQGNLIEFTYDANGNPLSVLAAGSINYQTGAISVSFSQAIPQGNSIQIQYNPTQLSIPLSILFFQNQFTLRPVPDKGYTIELVAYRQPTQALLTIGSNSGTPELSEWWECIAFGAAKKVYQDRLDMDGVALMDKWLQEKYQMIYTRTYAQLGKQRISTIYADQLSYNYGSGGPIGTGGL